MNLGIQDHLLVPKLRNLERGHRNARWPFGRYSIDKSRFILDTPRVPSRSPNPDIENQQFARTFRLDTHGNKTLYWFKYGLVEGPGHRISPSVFRDRG